MLKGSEKRMIVVRTHDSRLFEEAYFVVRREARSAPARRDRPEGDYAEFDMLREANGIIERALPADTSDGNKARGRKSPRRLIWFLSGLVSGGGMVGLLWLFL